MLFLKLNSLGQLTNKVFSSSEYMISFSSFMLPIFPNTHFDYLRFHGITVKFRYNPLPSGSK